MKKDDKKNKEKYILTGLALEEGKADNDSPELNVEFFKDSKSFKDGFPDDYKKWKKSRGRPKVEAPKKIKSFKLSQDVIEAIVSSGKGYNARVDKVLRDAIDSGRI